MSYAEQVGARLQEALEHAGMTAVELAHRLGLSKQQVHQWLHGRSAPGLESAAKLAEALGVSVDYLAGVGQKVTKRAKRPRRATTLREKTRG